MKEIDAPAFDLKMGVHQGSVLSQLLFIIVLEAILKGFCILASSRICYMLMTLSSWETQLNRTRHKRKTKSAKVSVNLGNTKMLYSCKNMNMYNEKGGQDSTVML